MTLQKVRVQQAVFTMPARDVFEYVLDVEAYPAFMPNVRLVEILSQEGTRRVTRWDTELEEAPICWTEEDVIDRVGMRITFDAVEGAFETFRGFWAVEERDDHVFVVCEIDYSIGIDVIEEMVGDVLKAKLVENLEVMLDGLVGSLNPDATESVDP